MSGSAPLILTLEIDERSFAFFDAQRKAYFPPERNVLQAHITLFHHLPGGERNAVETKLSRVSRHPRFVMRATGLRSLGRGVAYTLESVEADALRASLARVWADWLVPQDRQKHRLHLTIQNKVAPEIAQALLARLGTGFEPFAVTATGLRLWSYEGGPWRLLESFPFEA
jgi:hypothetical protein